MPSSQCTHTTSFPTNSAGMKAHFMHRLCCGCMEAAADVSSPPQPVYIEMSPRPPRPPAQPSSLDATVKKTSSPISSTSNRITKSIRISSIISSRSKVSYTKVEEEPKRAQENGMKRLVSEWRAPDQVTVKPLPSDVHVPAPAANLFFSIPSFTSPPLPHGNIQPLPTNEPSPLEEDSGKQVSETSAGTSTSQNIALDTLVPAYQKWAAAYALASPMPPSADPTRESFIARLVKGVQVLKHSYNGHSRIQVLCTLDGGETFTWREEETRDQADYIRHRSSAGSGIFGGGRESYAFGDIIEVRRGTALDLSAPGETGTALLRAACKNRDLSKSFSLITADRTIDFSCEQVEAMSFLVKGFMALSHEQRRRRVRRSSSGMGVRGA